MNRLFSLSQSKNILQRKRMNTILQEATKYRIVSLNAGAGFGKTQALSSFISDLDAHIVWISFTRLDNYTSHFWKNFCNAFTSIDYDFYQKIKSKEFPVNLPEIHQFIKLFTEKVYQDKPFVLVFDDCHFIQEPSIYNFIHQLIFTNVENMTVFLLSRPDTIINAKESLHGQSALMILEDTLAFTLEEIQEYSTMQNLALPRYTVRNIYEKTEGWPIAVYLTVLYMKENPSTVLNPNQIADQVTNPMVFDMIDREVFSMHSIQERKFLLKLSLLDSIPVKYIEQVYGQEAVSGMANMSKNLLIRYNVHTNAYDFHQLFQEFLETKLTFLEQSEIKETYAQAAQWYVQQDMKIDALNCYRKLEDPQGCWDIMWQMITLPHEPSHELSMLISGTIDEFSGRFGENEIWVPYILAVLNSWMAEFEEAEFQLSQLIETLSDQPKTEKNQMLIGESLLFLSFLYMLNGDIRFHELIVQARNYLPNGSHVYKTKRMMLLNGDCITLKNGVAGEMEQWVQAWEKAAPHMNFLIKDCVSGIDFLTKSQACYDYGEVAKSEQYALTALQRAKETTSVDIVGNAYYLLMKLAMYHGDLDRAQQYIEESSQYASDYNWHPRYNIPEIAAGFFYVQIDQSHKIADWILHDTIYGKSLLLSNYGLERLIKAMYLLARKEYIELFSYLASTEQIYITTHRTYAVICIYLLYAFAYHETGELENATAYFEKAYQLASPNKIIMPFIESGRYTRSTIEMIKLKQNTNIPAVWLDQMQTRASTYAKRINYMQREFIKRDPKHDQLKETITKREKKLLECLGQGLTREEIAGEMKISTNTVKSMLKTVYAKLGAVNGIHAIKIAVLNNIIS